jgi:hypothetical protein
LVSSVAVTGSPAIAIGVEIAARAAGSGAKTTAPSAPTRAQPMITAALVRPASPDGVVPNDASALCDMPYTVVLRPPIVKIHAFWVGRDGRTARLLIGHGGL